MTPSDDFEMICSRALAESIDGDNELNWDRES